MTAIPTSYPISAILPPEGSMGRDGYQECKLRKTSGKHPRWYCRYLVDVIAGPGRVRRVEQRKYFGLCAEVGKREAERNRDEFKRTVNTQRASGVRESQIPLSNWIRTYEATFLPTLKAGSQPVYQSTLRMIEREFGGKRLGDIDVDDIQQWMNRLSQTLAKATLQRILAVFASVYDRAIRSKRYEQRNPCELVDLPAGQRTTTDLRALEPDEIRRLLAVADQMEWGLGLMVRIALFCGLRIGEILALEYSDVRPPMLSVTKSRNQDGITTEPKTNAGRRVVPLGPVVIPPGTGRIFHAWEYERAHEHLRTAFDRARVSIVGTAWHALRRTFATYFDAAGASGLREQMGHATEQMSGTYVRRSFADHERAVSRMAEFILGDAEGRKQ